MPLYAAISLALILLGGGLVVSGIDGTLGSLSLAAGLVMMVVTTSGAVLRRRAERENATERDRRLHRFFPLVVLSLAIGVFVVLYGILTITLGGGAPA